MESINRSIDIESRRMELRGVVQLAGEVIAQYWPMRTFVHHNIFAFANEEITVKRNHGGRRTVGVGFLA